MTEPSAVDGRHDEAARLGPGAQPDVYEVFRQEKDGDPMRHAGNVRAPDAELALHYARELYSRRQESVRLWVVPRTAIRDLSDLDLLQPPLDRSFKKPGGYVMRDKLEAARRRAGTADEPTEDDGAAAGGGGDVPDHGGTVGPTDDTTPEQAS
jgi:ring-1,2-phenylacetyl-CoA epoxidase subunit PaaB